jgi:hypothetical protein
VYCSCYVNQCTACTAARDGIPLLVPLDHHGMPLVDPDTHQVLLVDPSAPPPPATTAYASSICYTEVQGDSLLPRLKLQQQAVAYEQQQLQQQAAALLLPATVPSTPVPSLPPTPRLAGRHTVSGAMSGSAFATYTHSSGTRTPGWATPRRGNGTASGTVTPRGAPATPRNTNGQYTGVSYRGGAAGGGASTPREGVTTPHTTTPSPSAGSPKRGSPMAVAAGAGGAAAAAAVAAGSSAADWSWAPSDGRAGQGQEITHSMHSSSSRWGATDNMSAVASTHNLLSSHSMGVSGALKSHGMEPLGPGTSPTASSAAMGAAASPFTVDAPSKPLQAGPGLMQEGSMGLGGGTRGRDSSSLQLLGLDHEPPSAGDSKISMIAPGGSPTASTAALRQQEQLRTESVFDYEQQQVEWVRPREQGLLRNSSKGGEGPQVMNVLATTPRAAELIRPEQS